MAVKKIWHQNGGNKGISTHAVAKKNNEIFECIYRCLTFLSEQQLYCFYLKRMADELA